MATGYLSKDTCFATEQEAKDALFEGYPPTIHHNTDTTVHTYQRDTSGNWYFVQDTYLPTGTKTQNYAVLLDTPNFGSCQTPNSRSESFSDGMQLGWAVAAAMITVYVIRRPYR